MSRWSGGCRIRARNQCGPQPPSRCRVESTEEDFVQAIPRPALILTRRSVQHPREWEWVGYHEIMGSRQRYRLIDVERLCWRLRADNVEEVRKNLIASLAQRIARAEVKREGRWTESLAVGSLEFVEKVKPLILFRRETEMVPRADDMWVLQEAAIPYGQKRGVKNASKAVD